jgi:hypothetical protein
VGYCSINLLFFPYSAGKCTFSYTISLFKELVDNSGITPVQGLAYAFGHLIGFALPITRLVERVEIESTSAALQVQLATLRTCLPILRFKNWWVPRESNSSGIHLTVLTPTHLQCAVKKGTHKKIMTSGLVKPGSAAAFPTTFIKLTSGLIRTNPLTVFDMARCAPNPILNNLMNSVI